jgi:hypothetical protein
MRAVCKFVFVQRKNPSSERHCFHGASYDIGTLWLGSSYDKIGSCHALRAGFRRVMPRRAMLRG